MAAAPERNHAACDKTHHPHSILPPMKILPFLAALPALSLIACQQKPKPKPQSTSPVTAEQASAIAKVAAQEAFQALSAELAAAMQQGGPVAAIPVCSDKAGSLVAEVASKHQLEMVRLSDKPRNANQQANGADADVLEAFFATIKNGETPKPAVELIKDGRATVRLPIVIANPLCLQCHGTEQEIQAETLTTLKAHYPNDKATGYKINDLRGIWKIKVPASAAR